MAQDAPKGEDFFAGAPEHVKKVADDWRWVSTVATNLSSGNAVADGVKATTSSLASTVASVSEMRSNAEATVNRMTTPPAFVEEYKDKFLDFRSRFKAPIVSTIAVLSVLPAMGAAGRYTKLRIGMRNLIVFGGGASVILYPELVMRVAPKVASSIDTVQVAVSSKISK